MWELQAQKNEPGLLVGDGVRVQGLVRVASDAHYRCRNVQHNRDRLSQAHEEEEQATINLLAPCDRKACATNFRMGLEINSQVLWSKTWDSN